MAPKGAIDPWPLGSWNLGTSTYRSRVDHVEGRVAAALAAGGRVVWEGDEHWTLADRAGNRVCITASPDGGTKAPS
jgi:hypothetical protein